MSNEVIKQEVGDFEVLNLTETSGIEISILVRINGMLFERFSHKHGLTPVNWKDVDKIIAVDGVLSTEQQTQVEAMFLANATPHTLKTVGYVEKKTNMEGDGIQQRCYINRKTNRQ